MSIRKVLITGFVGKVFAGNMLAKDEIDFQRFRDEKLHEIEKLTGRKIPSSVLDEITKVSRFDLSDIVKVLQEGVSIDDICKTLKIELPCVD